MVDNCFKFASIFSSLLRSPFIFSIFLFLASCDNSPENLSVSSLFSDGMVLQRDTTVAIWGQALPESNVYLYPSWGNMVKTKSDSTGFWRTFAKTTIDQKTHSLRIKSGKDIIFIKDILMGEVWIASGQSNMEMDFDYCCNSTDSADFVLNNDMFNSIRMFNVKKRYSLTPSSDIDGRWIKAVKDSIKPFSAVGYFFAKKLHNTLDVPIGIIHASWGGSDVESWISKKNLVSTKGFEERFITAQKSDKAQISREWFSNFKKINMPSAGFDLMLGTYFERSDTSINYLNYFLDDWKKIDLNDEEQILTLGNYYSWPELEFPGSLKNIEGLNDFNGVAIIKNEFFVDSIRNNYSIDMGEISLGWAGELREFDFYINGKKIGSTFGDENSSYVSKLGKKYRKHYTTSPFTYRLNQKVSSQNIKIGRNEIAIRVIGSGHISPITISSKGSEIELQNNWRFKISAEIYKQLSDYSYPYTSFYLYNKPNFNLADRPPITSYNFNEPSSLFNGMISPLIPYTIKGVVWYQGENNAFRHKEYGKLFSLLISDWRNKWDNDFSFYYVQIAPYFNFYNSNAPLREVQRKTLRVPKTGMVVTLDIGEKYDIHPSNKHDVGLRLARYALKNEYKVDLVHSGPLFRNHSVDEDVVKIFFDHIGNGLVLDENGYSEFEIAGLDKKYFEANVVNHNDYLEIFSDNVTNPMYVRYAWSDTSVASLFNSEGLPASSFDTENE